MRVVKNSKRPFNSPANNSEAASGCRISCCLLLGQRKHFTCLAAIKADCLSCRRGRTSIGFEIFCTFIDFRFTDAGQDELSRARLQLSLCTPAKFFNLQRAVKAFSRRIVLHFKRKWCASCGGTSCPQNGPLCFLPLLPFSFFFLLWLHPKNICIFI